MCTRAHTPHGKCHCITIESFGKNICTHTPHDKCHCITIEPSIYLHPKTDPHLTTLVIELNTSSCPWPHTHTHTHIYTGGKGHSEDLQVEMVSPIVRHT